MQQTRFDARRFLSDTLGSAPSVVNFIKSFGFTPPTQEAVSKWSLRGQVSAEWLPILLVLLELDHGKPVSLTRYVQIPVGEK
jgi:hypothetical protein